MNSTPTKTSTFRSDPVGSMAFPQKMRLISGAFVLGLAFFLLVIGRGEISRWHFASARNAIEDERYEDAIKAANAGLRWDPEYSDLIALRAAARYQQKDFEGCLQDYDEMIAIAAKDETINEDDIRPISAQASVLQRLDRFEEAIAEMSKVVNFRKEQFELRDDSESQYLYAFSLNNRAYMQAQARLNVAQAFEDIKLAIEIRERKDDHIMVDTLGYLQLLNGEHDDALYTLNMAVGLAEKDKKQKRLKIEQLMQQDQRTYKAELRQLDENYSIILHHRGEAYKALAEDEQAAADLEEAKRLGYNPDEGIW